MSTTIIKQNNMQQLSRAKAILFHLYPGIFITIGFILLTPVFMKYGFPPQFGMLLSIVVVAVPLLIVHMLRAKKQENKKSIYELNGYTRKLSTGKLILYALGLVVFAFVV